MGQTIELPVKRTPVREDAVLRGDDRARVVAAMPPAMKAQPQIDRAIRAAERALETALWAREQGFDQNPQRIDPSVRTELEELGRQFAGWPRPLSEDAKRLLDATDLPVWHRPLWEVEKRLLCATDLPAGGPDDGFDLLARVEAIVARWVRRAIALFDEESQTKISSGPGHRWDLRLACEELVDLWGRYAKPGFWRRDNAPLLNFVRAVIQTIEPEFQGEKLVREGKSRWKEIIVKLCIPWKSDYVAFAYLNGEHKVIETLKKSSAGAEDDGAGTTL